jgi:hypothetical protein
MADVLTLLAAVSSNQTGTAFEASDLRDELTMEVVISGTVSAYSVQLQGSMDGTNWISVGVPQTSSGAAGTAIGPVTQSTGLVAISSGYLVRYLRAVLSGYTGTGTVTAKVATGAGM